MPLDTSQPWKSARLARDLCGLITCLDEPQPVEFMKARFPDLVPQNVDVIVRPADAVCPLTIGFMLDRWLIILCQGVKRTDTATNFFRGYNTPKFGPGVGAHDAGMNGFLWQSKQTLVAWMQANFTVTPATLIMFAGHSYGGANAQALAAHWHNYEFSRVSYIGCVTFGSPRVGANYWVRANATFFNSRWYNVDDPVRHCPPNATEAPLAHGIMPRAISESIRFYVHCGDGLALMNTGSVEQREDVPPVPAIADRDLVTWATGMSNENVRAHNIREYFLRTQGALDLFNFSVPNTPTATPMNNIPPALSQPAQQQPVVAAAVHTEVQAAQVRTQRLVSTRTPRQFRVVRRTGAWIVIDSAGYAVNVPASKSRARSIAFRANELYREAIANGETDFTALRTQVGQMI